MTALTDLTWQQVETASGITGAISVVSNKVVIDVSLITGTTVSDLTQQGVVDFLIKLREFCATAQASANTNQAAGEKLAAFPALTYGTLAANGTVQVQGNIVGKMTISTQSLHLVGINA